MSVAGLFFYGSLLSLFTEANTTSGHVARAILFKIPRVGVPADGGPFDHLLVGHSLLHGLGAITAIIGLCLAERQRETALNWRAIILLALPSLAVPVHTVAALYCVGAAGILLFWGRLGAVRSWLSILLMACLFLTAWNLMGYHRAPDAAGATIKADLDWSWQWWTLVLWFTVGLGFRIVGFSWISQPLKDPLVALGLSTVVGLLAFFLLLQLRDGNERYGIYFLQSIFSIFAFSRLTPGFWRGAERSQWVEEWLRLTKKSVIVLLACAVLLRIVIYAVHSQAWIASLRLQILPCVLLILLMTGALALMKRSLRFSAISSAILMGVLAVGFLAWTTVWLRYGMGRVKTGVTYPASEVRGLRRLGELMASDERFATNKHALDAESLAPPRERSYGYSALSGRPVLLEGYLSRGEYALPWFKTLLHDNDLLFSVTDPETLHNIARAWHVRWLVARPGTDIALARPLPPWLIEQQNCGDLKIYKID
jgi:hypothetical protein